MAATQALPAIPFELDLEARTMRGVLTRPDLAPPHPTVVFLPDPPGATHSFDHLRESIAASFIASGMATATYVTFHDDGAPLVAGTLVDDAAAVFEHLGRRDDVEASRLGLIACGAAAIVASALVARGVGIARLALLGATTGNALKQRAAKSNGVPPIVDADEAYVNGLAALAVPADLATHPTATLILHGAADRVVPPAEARPYVLALENVERPARHELVARGDHALSDDVVREVAAARLVDFFGRRDNA